MELLLCDDNLIEGIRKCIINAESLIQDAYLLKENGRKERAYTLFQLSIEELGKASIVYFFATLPDADKSNTLKIFKKEFLSHKTKTAKAINFDAVMLSSINNRTERHKLLYAILMEHENIDTLNDFKNYSLYTSIINEKFLLPSETISEDLLEEIEARATLRYELMKPMLEFLLNGFDEVKKANIKYDNDQIQIWVDEFISDLLDGKV